MLSNLAFLLYGTVFLAALLLVHGLHTLHADHRAGRDAMNRRMRELAPHHAPGVAAHEGFETLRRPPRTGFALLGPLGGLSGRLDRLIRHAGLTVSVRRMLAAMAALAVAVSATLLILAPGLAGHGGLATTAAVSAGAAGLALPLLVLNYIKRERLKLVAEQLPDALELMARSLQAGHPVNAALTLVAKEMPDPIGSEFGLAVDELTYGLDLREALANLCDRTPLEDLQYIIVSINIQHETGGNLAEVLNGLSIVMRARHRVFKKIKALSAEARLSAKLLAAMPFLFGGLVFASRPDFFTDVADDPLFVPLLGMAFALELIGILVMRRLVNFRV